MSTDVEYYTRLAQENLHEKNYEDAINNFSEALKCAQNSCDTEVICKCRLNVGAVLVALGRTSEGLKDLESVKPLERDHQLTGDVCYNLCLAHENLNNIAKAIECIQQAIKHYSECFDGVVLKADSTCRLASLYTKLQDFQKAAEAYAGAAHLYGTAGDVPQQAACLLQQAKLLQTCYKSASAIDVANECAKLCTEQPDPGLDIGQLLNDVGLFYAACKKYKKALLCFEQVEKISQCHSKDPDLEAVVLQNIGAMYNCLSNYKKSIEYNRQASEIYEHTDNRIEQGKCFGNIAYAYSQLPDIEMACDYYKHALQAAKDKDDKISESQVLEGLSSVFFQQKQYDRSLASLNGALDAASADSSVTSSDVRQRIIKKLNTVNKFQQTNLSTLQQTPTTSEDMIINDCTCSSSGSDKDENSPEDSDPDDVEHETTGDKGEASGTQQYTAKKRRSSNGSQACVVM